MNVRKEIEKVWKSPVRLLVGRLGRDLGRGEPHIKAFENAYRHYALSCERTLLEWSVARRYGNGPHYIRKYGGKFSPAQKKVAKHFHEIAPFMEYDVFNAILHARILLDRTIGLARFFLPMTGQRPSFSSFNEHRKFFVNRNVPGMTDIRYANFIRDDTDWLMDVLKEFRDHALVHAQQAAWTALATGWAREENDLILMYNLPNRPLNTESSMTLPQFLKEMRDFLSEFNRLGRRALNGHL